MSSKTPKYKPLSFEELKEEGIKQLQKYFDEIYNLQNNFVYTTKSVEELQEFLKEKRQEPETENKIEVLPSDEDWNIL